MSSHRSSRSGRDKLRAAMSGGLLAAAAALCLSACSGHAASSQVEPALPGQWGPLGETYVFVTPTQDSPKTISFNVAGQVPTAMRSEICAGTSLKLTVRPPPPRTAGGSWTKATTTSASCVSRSRRSPPHGSGSPCVRAQPN